ncbi:MAG: phytanoyl-CoA dioxygenase family protein [Pseudomonadota bacterium]
MSTLEVLNRSQVEHYRDQGYLVLKRHVPTETIEAIRQEIARFETEAHDMSESNERIDLEDSHTPQSPRLRRIKLPHTTSPIMRDLMLSDMILAPVRDLLGPNLRLHTSKLNMKSAGYGAAIEWHQDFAFYPHTNDDVLAVGVMIDDMFSANGPLMVFPGSHRGPLHNHHSDGVFVGAMDLEACGLNLAQAVELTGPAGSVSIHHARIVHGSALNTSDRDRRLLFYEMMAADAFPVMGSMTTFNSLEDYNSRMLCGEPGITPRLEPVPVRIPLPQPDRNRSIYEVQSGLQRRSFDTHNSGNNQ